MENLTQIAQLLGEENEKKLKDGIVNLILKQVEEDLKDYTEWIVDPEDLRYEINEDVRKIVKEKVVKKYADKLESKFDEILEKII